MADNLPAPESASPPPVPPASGSGAGKPPPLPAPEARKNPAGKQVVMLSSVAKAVPSEDSQLILGPNVPTNKATPPPTPDAKAHKPGESRWPSLSGSPVGSPTPLPVPATPEAKDAPARKVTPPPLPARRELVMPKVGPLPTTPDMPKAPEMPKIDAKKTSGKLIPPIKLNPPPQTKNTAAESIFLDIPDPEPEPEHPAGWKQLEPGELLPPSEGLQSLDVFARSQKILDKPEAVTPVAVPEVKPPEILKPPVLPPARPFVTLPPIALHQTPNVLQPPVVITARPPEVETKGQVAPPLVHHPKTDGHGLHVAPPLVDNEPNVPAHTEKLRPPQLPPEPRKEEMTTIVVSKSVDPIPHKAPAMISTEAKAVSTPPPSLPTKALPLTPTPPPVPAKVSGPIVLSSTAKQDAVPTVEVKSAPPVVGATPSIKVEDGKPALRPPVLSNRALANSKAGELEAPVPVAAPEAVVKVPAPAVEAAAALKPPVDLKTPAPAAVAVVPRAEKAPLPLTRAARAKKRRVVEMVIFYIIMVLVGGALYFGSLYVCHETRLEGQVIPPSGMPLNNEVWIVIDFRKLTEGIAEDLAAERAPIMQEIQERQEHVQRAQADIATREERIRLLQGQVDTAKTDLNNIGVQAREATQQIWDGPGAQLDDEYNAKIAELKRAIADRAKSLNLKYAPDDSYNSPEVWANAYRLALYDVPASVDGLKEHQWLGEQMKQWRAFLKTLDDRKEQLRDQAAQIKIAPAAKITELTGKVDELQHRIEITRTEEDPIKVELQQAQSDLAQAQAAEAGLDDKYYQQLNSLPGENVIKHIPLLSNGRFTWIEDTAFVEGENEHHYWIFSRAIRPDGRQYWSLAPFTISKDETLGLTIEPESFVSTKAILRPNLPPDEQNQ